MSDFYNTNKITMKIEFSETDDSIKGYVIDRWGMVLNKDYVLESA